MSMMVNPSGFQQVVAAGQPFKLRLRKKQDQNQEPEKPKPEEHEEQAADEESD